MSVPPPAPCPLCHAAAPFWLQESRRRMPARNYHRCANCSLVFVPAAFHLDAAAERAEYDLHRNDPLDEGYRRFLGRLVAPLCRRLPAGAAGLDFGCGPGPVLQQLLQERGFACAAYDPYYQPDNAALEARYAFITCTEVVEHFAQPRASFDLLHTLLESGGILAIMTRRPGDAAAFAIWHYSRDPTHIAFYALETFDWIASHYGLCVEVLADDIVLLHKRPADATIAHRPPGPVLP